MQEETGDALARAHRQIYEQEHYYHNDKPQCPYRSVVGAASTLGIGGQICCCELVAGHDTEHERVSTGRLATADVASKLDVFEDFLSLRPVKYT